MASDDRTPERAGPRAPAPEETLAWEAERRPRAGVAAIAAAVLTIIGSIVSGLALRGGPDDEDDVLTVVDTLGRAAQGQENPGGRLAETTLYLGDHLVAPIAGAVLYGLGSVLIFLPLAVLFRATRARRPQLAQFALVLLAIGVAAFGVGRTVAQVAYALAARSFRDSADQSNSAAADALSGGVIVFGQAIWQLGALSLGLAFVLIALNAMRAGLLTRFMGILGLIVGATFVLPLDQQGIIRVFWLGALGMLLLGRWRGGAPPAWATGRAEPWPSQQELRERRAGARGETAEEAPAEAVTVPDDERPAGDPSDPRRPPAPQRPAPSGAEPHPSSRKKRKRRS